MSYIALRITTHQDERRATLATGTVCANCRQPITKGQCYTVHTFRTAAMPAASFNYFHAEHAPKQGSGWGEFYRGEPITSPEQVDEGDLLLCYSRQFDAYNVVRVTTCQSEQGTLARRRLHGTFVDPCDASKPRRDSRGEFCIWDHDLGRTRMLYRAVITSSHH